MAADRVVAAYALGHDASWADLVGLVENFAEVRLRRLPAGLDGLACRYPESGSRPVVFVDNLLPVNRRRFTLAHELAHIALGWHCHALTACNTDLRAWDDAPTDDVRLDEQEANSFAAHVLVPEAFLTRLTRGQPALNPADAIREAYKAVASSTVVSLRLLDHLPKGWSFVEEFEGETRYRGAVPGTATRLPYPGQKFDRRALTAGADEVVTIRRSTTTWWAYFGSGAPSDPSDIRRSRAILDSILEDKSTPDVMPSLRQTIGGIVGAANSQHGASCARADDFAAVLRQRFANHPDLAALVSHEEWPAFVRRRAEEIMAKRSSD